MLQTVVLFLKTLLKTLKVPGWQTLFSAVWVESRPVRNPGGKPGWAKCWAFGLCLIGVASGGPKSLNLPAHTAQMQRFPPPEGAKGTQAPVFSGKKSPPSRSNAAVVWPTPHSAFLQGRPISAWVQPTASGRLESGLFGWVRNGGTRFHGGIDIKPVVRDRRGEPQDPVFAAMAGRVVYVNDKPGHSGFGRYVVLEHTSLKSRAHTLYAHLAKVKVRKGAWVKAGESIGQMGRSAVYPIPKERSHLHFEVGVLLSEHFPQWYRQQGFAQPNHHGNYSGLNMARIDPLDFYQKLRAGQVQDLDDYLKKQPCAVQLRLRTHKVPDFVRKHAYFLEGTIPYSKELVGWEVDLSWTGFPKRLRPLTGPSDKMDRFNPPIELAPGVTLLGYQKAELLEHKTPDMLKFGPKGKVAPGKRLQRTLSLLFPEGL